MKSFLAPVSSLSLLLVACAAFLMAQNAGIPRRPAITIAPNREPLTVITGVRLIDGTGRPPVKQASIVMEHGRILAAGDIDVAPWTQKPGVTLVDATGKIAIPGLISNHSHLGIVADGTYDPAHFTRETVEAALQQYERYGITTVTSLGMSQDLIYQIRDRQRAGNEGGADLFTAGRGIAVTNGAPPLDAPSSQLARVSTPEEGREAVREMAAHRPDLLKIWNDTFFGATRRMPQEIFAAIIDEAHQQNLPVAAHLFFLEDGKALLRSGVDVVAHSVRDQPVDQEFIDLMKARGASYIATLALDEAQFAYADHPDWMDRAAFREAVSSPKLLETWASEDYVRSVRDNPNTPRNRAALEMAMKNVKALHDAGILIGFGTDSGATPTRLPGWAEHRELQLLVKAGLTPMEALLCATRNAAKLLGDEANRGTIEAGKRADFLLLDADPLQDIYNTLKIKAIYHGGRRIEPAFRDETP